MKAVVQRVQDAQVTVNNKVIGRIDKGMLIYLGIEVDDTETMLLQFSEKILKFRMFPDENQKMNLNLKQVNGSVLLVSQFTLCADLKKGNRPSFNPAAAPEKANDFYEKLIVLIKKHGVEVQTGEFGADMKVNYQNNGPETFIFEL